MVSRLEREIANVTLQLSAYCVKLVSQNSERETVENCGTLCVEWQVSLERGEDKARKERDLK